MKKQFPLLVLALVLLSGCAVLSPSLQPASRVSTLTTIPSTILAPTPLLTNIVTSTQSPKDTKPRPTATPTTVLVVQGPGNILCPILLYHRIDDLKTTNPYVLGVKEFEEEMALLNQRGYKTITVTQLIKAINFGAPLPERPIIISFDDGDASVYKNAYPIMKELGFVGVGYLVGNYLGADGYMDVAQVQKMAKRGWEFGSHTQSHVDLSGCKWCDYEVVQSKHNLEKALGLKIDTFAYPFGILTQNSVFTVSGNYRGAVGISVLTLQGPNNLFNLWRRPIDNGTTIETFASYLPW